jgi:hypothetical protein
MCNDRVPRRRLHDICVCSLCVAPFLFAGSVLAQRYGEPNTVRTPAGGGETNPNGWFPLHVLPPYPPSPSDGGAPPAPASTPTASEADELKALLTDGPQFPLARPADRFEVIGLANAGWPVVLDFMPAPNSCTFLVVTIGGKAAAPAVIDADGHIGRHLFRADFELKPVYHPTPARYLVQSVTPACPSGSLPSNGASLSPSPLEVYGIGAGPGAVGSISVTDLHIGPPRPNLSAGQITWSFETKTVFNHATLSFLRFERSPRDGSIVATPVRSFAAPSLVGQQHSGQWDALDNNGHLSPGIHRLEVRAWDNQENDKSWAGGISNDFVTITRP